jgi:hypothetical protein
VRVCSRHSHVELTTLESSQRSSITTSLRIPLQTEAALQADTARFVLILYAATAGALVDLAADLTWLTGRRTSYASTTTSRESSTFTHPSPCARSPRSTKPSEH